ncbi:uncharacterized protein H6S33_002941 [Morchella sextelata]|jgi:hypothetical protein|uniref:uncharacterized protein n=1 Tax=Morchella sextelata TaxID=1174677 RepID=UPI001D03C91D|nr:uncharacterized protein H6S33_002941 [Morchella sextelata]KAH0606953.1 hypothetical protein H6S33_002941 [Morchella sextelata]
MDFIEFIINLFFCGHFWSWNTSTPQDTPSYMTQNDRIIPPEEERKYIGGYTVDEFLAAERAAENEILASIGLGNEIHTIGATGEGTIDYDDPSLHFITEPAGIRDD